MQLREVLSYELATVPYALVHVDGSLGKATKSVLLAELEKAVDVLPRFPLQENTTENSLHLRWNGHCANGQSWWCTEFWGTGREILPDYQGPISTARMQQGGCRL